MPVAPPARPGLRAQSVRAAEGHQRPLHGIGLASLDPDLSSACGPERAARSWPVPVVPLGCLQPPTDPLHRGRQLQGRGAPRGGEQRREPEGQGGLAAGRRADQQVAADGPASLLQAQRAREPAKAARGHRQAYRVGGGGSSLKSTISCMVSMNRWRMSWVIGVWLWVPNQRSKIACGSGWPSRKPFM